MIRRCAVYFHAGVVLGITVVIPKLGTVVSRECMSGPFRNRPESSSGHLSHALCGYRSKLVRKRIAASSLNVGEYPLRFLLANDGIPLPVANARPFLHNARSFSNTLDFHCLVTLHTYP